mgnify:CR=1 FL=1
MAMKKLDPLLDPDFLRKLDEFEHKVIYAKIIALDSNENSTQEITGVITGGSISVDGTSAVRRTCSLTLVAQNINVDDFYWGVNAKFKLEIGLENNINSNYPDIIWFKQGTYLISSFNSSLATNTYTISIQGKDKMVLLNGEVGGIVPSSWDFAKIDETKPDGSIEQTQYPIKDIILQGVHEYAQEPWENIIVNDLDDYGIELLEYEGDSPFYYLIRYDASGSDSREVANMTMNSGMKCFVRLDRYNNGRVESTEWKDATLGEIENIAVPESGTHYSYEKLIDELDPAGNVSESSQYLRAIIKLQDDKAQTLYTVAKIESQGSMKVCGYRLTDITYPYDLIVAPGTSFTTGVLDPIVQMLGNFEYFYNVDGQFVFQKKKTFTDTSYNNLVSEHSINGEAWAGSKQDGSKYSYVFNGNKLIGALQSSPQLSNLKNDFSIWGQRTYDQINVPIHARYAIDHKPMWYRAIGNHIHRNKTTWLTEKINGTQLQVRDTKDHTVKTLSTDYDYDNAGDIYCTQEGWDKYQEAIKEYKLTDAVNRTDKKVHIVDWREIIYQMANDYRRHYHEEGFLDQVRQNNYILTTNQKENVEGADDSYVIYKHNGYDSWYPKGFTGYEKYYVDFEMNLSQGSLAYWRELYNPECIKDSGETVGMYKPTGDWEPDDSLEVWSADKIYDKDRRIKYNGTVYRSTKWSNSTEPGTPGSADWVEDIGTYTYNADGWNPDILNDPEKLNFWFDFLDTTGELNAYAVQNIGQRSKATNDTTIKSIYFKETPNVIFYTSDADKEKQEIVNSNSHKPGYSYIHIPEGLDDLFSISSQGKSAMDVIDEYMYDYLYPATQISLTTVPIYYLSPNTLIYLDDKTTGTVGEYIAQKFSYSLGTTTTMSITAVETAKRIY